MWLPYFSW